MSYQLVFWKQSASAVTMPQSVYERLMAGERVAGLCDLPGDRFLARIAEHFTAGWERLDDYNWEHVDGSFQVAVGPQHFLVISYNLPGEVLNEFIDLAAEFGCKLYDPQTGERFEG